MTMTTTCQLVDIDRLHIDELAHEPNPLQDEKGGATRFEIEPEDQETFDLGQTAIFDEFGYLVEDED